MRVAYVSHNPFLEDSAMSFRITGVAQALALGGHDVTVISPAPTRSAHRQIEPTVQILTTKPLRRNHSRVSGALKSLARGEPEMGALLRDGSYDAVLGYGSQSGLLRQMRRSGLQPRHLLLDVVEWYQLQHLWKPPQWPIAIEHELAMRRRATGVGGVLAISSYLEEYFVSKGTRALRIPPLFNLAAAAEPGLLRDSDGMTHVTIAGTVGGKEAASIRHTLHAAAALNESQPTVVVHLVGPDLSAVRRIPGLRDSAIASAKIHGRVPHGKALRIVAASDFVAIQRPASQRYARAGFPSKVVEAWSLGTPAITNLTSDLGMYCKEGVNAIIIGSDCEDSMVAALARAIETRERFDRSAIRTWASKCFSPTAYAEAISTFVESVAA